MSPHDAIVSVTDLPLDEEMEREVLPSHLFPLPSNNVSVATFGIQTKLALILKCCNIVIVVYYVY